MTLPRSLLAGLALTGPVAAAALLSVVWTPHDTAALDIAARLLPPDASHWMGTDHFGRDVLSLAMAGARTSLLVALSAVGIGIAAGVPVGLLAAARHGGWRDGLLMRGADVIFAFPSLVTAILLAAVAGPSALNAVTAIGIFNIPVFARVARGAALPLWSLDFIRAARLAGKGSARISAEHILPNIAPVLIVQATIQISVGLLAEAALSYVGLGAQPPTPSLGRMLAEAQTMVAFAPHLALFPGALIALTALGLNLTGDGLRALADPRRETAA